MLSSVYDPLALTSPFILRARKIVQNLWLEKLDRDDPVRDKHPQRWNRWIRALMDAPKFGVLRWVQPLAAVKRQRHHFSDESANADDISSYLRS